MKRTGYCQMTAGNMQKNPGASRELQAGDKRCQFALKGLLGARRIGSPPHPILRHTESNEVDSDIKDQ